MEYITSVIVGMVVLLHHQFPVNGAVLRYGTNHLASSNSSQLPNKTNPDSGNLTTESSYSPDIESITTDPGNSTDLYQLSNETDSDSGNSTDLYLSTTEESSSPNTVTNPDVTEVNTGCLHMTYNNTKLIYKFPDSHYNIWFKALKEGASIELKFDFSMSLHGKFQDELLVSGPTYQYRVLPWEWDKIEIVTGKHIEDICRSWAQLKIPNIKVEECLPHHTISRMQVSSSNSLVIWSTCLPQGQWWDDVNKPSSVPEQNEGSGSIIALAVCLGFTLLFLALLGTYACHHRTNAKNHKSERIPRVEEESDYAEWEDIRSQVQLTPPSSVSYNSTTTNGTVKKLLPS